MADYLCRCFFLKRGYVQHLIKGKNSRTALNCAGAARFVIWLEVIAQANLESSRITAVFAGYFTELR
jgi:hypothetical protein